MGTLNVIVFLSIILSVLIFLFSSLYLIFHEFIYPIAECLNRLRGCKVSQRPRITPEDIRLLNTVILLSGLVVAFLLVKSTESVNNIFDAPALFQLGAISLLIVTFLKENKNIKNDVLLAFGNQGTIVFFGAGILNMYSELFQTNPTRFIELFKVVLIYLGGLNLFSAAREIAKQEEKHGRTAKRK